MRMRSGYPPRQFPQKKEVNNTENVTFEKAIDFSTKMIKTLKEMEMDICELIFAVSLFLTGIYFTDKNIYKAITMMTKKMIKELGE